MYYLLKTEIHWLHFYMVLGNDFTNILKHSVERRRACTLVGNSCLWWQQVWWERVVFQDDVESDQRLALIKPSSFTYRNISHILIKDIQVLLRITFPVLTCLHCPFTHQMLELSIHLSACMHYYVWPFWRHVLQTCLSVVFCTRSITGCGCPVYLLSFSLTLEFLIVEP